MRKIPLKLRLTIWYMILMIVVSAITLTAITSMSKNMVEGDARQRLEESVDMMARMLSGKNPNFEERRGAEPRPEWHPKFYEQGVHMVVFDEEKNVIGGQIPFSITDDLDFENSTIRKETYDGNQYLVYDKEVRADDGSLNYIKGFVSVDEDNYALMSVLKNNMILTIILILIAGAGGYFITRRALLPVNVMSKTAKSIIESKDLSQRINIDKGDDEISSLALTLDEMLSEIQGAFEREQQFTSDASHELRTPIAVILSECEYMTDCADTVDELKASAESVKEEAQRMSKLVSELLTISRMDKDTLKLNFEETQLSELVNFVCSEQEEINDKSMILTRNIGENITADTDRFLIARLFINLISNAYKYNKENGTVTVSLFEKDENIVFSVSDTGIGISKENLPKIWERFYQVDPSRTANENGSMGLGLSMVEWIAKRHGGKITVDSKIGEGSSFVFVFPKKQQ